MLTIGKIEIARPAEVSLSGSGLADVQICAAVTSEDFAIRANWIAKEISAELLAAVQELALAVDDEAAKHGTSQGVYRIVLTENAEKTGHVFFGKARLADKSQWFRFDPGQVPAVADPVGTVVSEVSNAAAGLIIDAVPGDPPQTKEIVIVGPGEKIAYSFRVEAGTIEKFADAARGISINENDVITGGTAVAGSVAGGKDGFRYTGTVRDFSAPDTVTVEIDGQTVPPSDVNGR
jgi:hypothetical protein